jgi:hypothetical protein
MTTRLIFAILVRMFHFEHAKMPMYDVSHASGNLLSLLALTLYAMQLFRISAASTFFQYKKYFITKLQNYKYIFLEFYI